MSRCRHALVLLSFSPLDVQIGIFNPGLGDPRNLDQNQTPWTSEFGTNVEPAIGAVVFPKISARVPIHNALRDEYATPSSSELKVRSCFRFGAPVRGAEYSTAGPESMTDTLESRKILPVAAFWRFDGRVFSSPSSGSNKHAACFHF